VILSGVIASSGGVASSFESIFSSTLSSSQSSVVWSSIPQTFTHLQIRITALTTASTIQPQMRVGNGSVDTGANYSRHSLYGNGAAAAAYGAASVNQYVIGGLDTGMNTTNPYVCVIDLLNYTSTNMYKTVRSLSGTDRNGSGEIGLHSGVWMSTSAINIISILSSGTYAQYSSFALYGVKA
jgi:hypothetical protein